MPGHRILRLERLAGKPPTLRRRKSKRKGVPSERGSGCQRLFARQTKARLTSASRRRPIDAERGAVQDRVGLSPSGQISRAEDSLRVCALRLPTRNRESTTPAAKRLPMKKCSTYLVVSFTISISSRIASTTNAGSSL